MTRIVFYGIVAGCYISTGFIASEILFPAPAFGAMPLWLVLLPLAALFLINSGATKKNGASTKDRILSAVLAAAVPFIVYGLYQATHYAAFVGQAGLLNFAYLWLVYVFLVGLPLVLLGRMLPAASESSDTPMVMFALLGAAAGLFLHQQLADSLAVPWLSMLTAAVTMILPLAMSNTRRLKQQPSAPKSEKRPASPAKTTPKKGSKSTAKRRPYDTYPAMYSYLNAFLVFVLLPAWLLVHFQKASQFLAGGESVYGLLLPLVIACFAGGVLLVRRLAPERNVLWMMAGLVLFAAGIIAGMYRWQHVLFPDLYTAYYNGAEVTYFLAEWLILTVFLPTLAAGLLFGLMQNKVTVGTRIARGGAVVLLCIFAVLLIPGILNAESVHVLFVIAGLFLALYLAGVAGRHVPLNLPLRIAISVSTGAVLFVLTLNLPRPGFENLFDPTSFRIIHDDQSPGGRTTLLKSRSYDDPFYAVFWNQSVPVSQNSEGVRPTLQRVIHVPMLIHPKPERVLLLGLGAFEELSALDLHAPESVTAVEHNPAHIACYRQWLKDRRDSLRPYLRIHAERLPAFVARNTNVFDVVISGEPFAVPHPLPAVFTVEYYRDIRRATGDAGLFVQWLPLNKLTEKTLASVTAGIRAAFSHTRLWTGTLHEEGAMVAILASNAEIQFSERFRSALRTIAQDEAQAFQLRQLGMPSWEYIAAEYGGGKEVSAWLAGSAEPVSAFDSRAFMQTTPLDIDPSSALMRILQRREFDPALVEGSPDSVQNIVTSMFMARPQVLHATMQLRGIVDTSAARTLLNIVQQQPYNIEAGAALAEAFLRQAEQFLADGNYNAAYPILLQAANMTSLNTYLLRLLMITALQVGDKETAQTCISGIKRLNPTHAGAKDNEATIKAQQGGVQGAMLIYENAITLDAKNEDFYYNMASAQYKEGRAWEAVRILDNAIEKAYYPAKAYFLRAMIYAEQGKTDLAIESFDEFFRLAKPNDSNRSTAEETIRNLTSGSDF